MASDIRVAVRRAGVARWEQEGLRQSLAALLQRGPADARVVVPFGAESRRLVKLTIIVRRGRIESWVLDETPAADDPEMVEYCQRYDVWRNEKAAGEDRNHG